MSTIITKPQPSAVEYPDDNGEPMAENTLQFKWIVLVKEGLETLFFHDPDVFVAGDLLWYPVEGEPRICRPPTPWSSSAGPRAIAARTSSGKRAGSPPGRLRDPLPWQPRRADAAKLEFYDRYGVEEYYIYDPETGELVGWLRGPRASRWSRTCAATSAPPGDPVRAGRRARQPQDHRPPRAAICHSPGIDGA